MNEKTDEKRVFCFAEDSLIKLLLKSDLSEEERLLVCDFLFSEACHGELFKFAGEYKSAYE